MGCFSWLTQDTNISCAIDNYKNTCVYYMWDNNGNYWKETSYEGYGVFGGKDYFILLYEMNAPEESKEEIKNKIREAEKRRDEDEELEDEEFENMRKEGIEMYYSNNTSILFPNLSESKRWKWRNEKPKECEYQGFVNLQKSKSSGNLEVPIGVPKRYY